MGPVHGGDGPGGCPDLELIAALADRRLAGDEAVRVEEHIAGCAECYAVLAETLSLGIEEADAAGARSEVAAPILPKAFALARGPGLKIAAGLVLAIGAVLLAVSTRNAARHASPVAELVEALGDRRPIEPRLTGGFHYGRLIALRSGEAPQGLDAQPAAVIAAVAKIRQRAEGDASPRALGALGATYLVSGDADAAVKALESASSQEPQNGRLLSDLAAAYLVRAAQADEPADLPKALDTAERAIASKDAPLEACFNRALALEALHLVDAAREAWGVYLQRDASSGWADEARRHVEALAKPRQSSAEEDKARVRAALAEGPAAADRLADEAPQLLRDYFEDELLPAWAEAHLVGHPDARLHREQLQLLGDALHRSTGDPMARDTAHALLAPTAALTSHDPLRSQALGHRAFHEGQQQYELQQPACSAFRDAQRDLQAGGSPHAAWAGLQVVITCLYPTEAAESLAQLAGLEAVGKQGGYEQLLGRVHWMQGLIYLNRGELTRSLQHYRLARARFRTTRDADSEALMLTATAENLGVLGEGRNAWTERRRSLALLSLVREPRRQHVMLTEAALACLDDRLPRAALHFETAVVAVAPKWSQGGAVADAFVRRANIRHHLGDDDFAASDLLEARRWIARMADAAVAKRTNADADAVEGEVLLGRQPDAAAHSLDRALSYFRGAAPARLAPLHLLLARAEIAQGRDDAGREQLLAGIREMERQRDSLGEASAHGSFFGQALPLFDDMVRLEITKRHDPVRALAFLERSRARPLVGSPPRLPTKESHRADTQAAAGAPLDPEAIQQGLAEGTAIVYYAWIDQRLFAWVLDRGASHFVEGLRSASELSPLVAAQRAALERRASLEVVRELGARLYDGLVRPLTPFLGVNRALVLVPDGVLQSVAFPALWNNETRRYLVEEHLLALAPSGTVFVRASAAASAAPLGPGPRALIVGNPHFDRHLWFGRGDLPAAEAEATEIASLYDHPKLLTGGGATRAAFLEGLRGRSVLHYAGHASAPETRARARLLLAPDPRVGDSGALDLQELGRPALAGIRVAVLAACRTAEGAVSRVEGPGSLAQAFLAAGVSDVVASLWDVDDSVSRRFFVAFHRALRAVGDPAMAVRQAQIGLLRDSDALVAHPASWAAFLCVGGLEGDSLSKGDLS